MKPSFVCFADILGYSAMSNQAIKSGHGDIFLNRLNSALSNAYKRVEDRAGGLFTSDNFYQVKVFTDNIVVGYPVSDFSYNQGEPELGDILSIFAEFQAGLVMEGFLVRGGISFGDHYMDDNIVFGDALIDAVEIEKKGGPPRIRITPKVEKIVRKQLSFYSEIKWSPQSRDLLEDSDGSIFLNYLDEAFMAFPEGGIFFDLIEAHKKVVEQGLNDHKGNTHILSKYEWAARYHNFICTEFANTHPTTNPNLDDEIGAAHIEAQKLLNYIIDLSRFEPSPKRIS